MCHVIWEKTGIRAQHFKCNKEQQQRALKRQHFWAVCTKRQWSSECPEIWRAHPCIIFVFRILWAPTNDKKLTLQWYRTCSGKKTALKWAFPPSTHSLSRELNRKSSWRVISPNQISPKNDRKRKSVCASNRISNYRPRHMASLKYYRSAMLSSAFTGNLMYATVC